MTDDLSVPVAPAGEIASAADATVPEAGKLDHSVGQVAAAGAAPEESRESVASHVKSLEEQLRWAESRAEERHAVALAEHADLAARYEEVAAAVLALLEANAPEEDPARKQERAMAEHRRWYAGVVDRVRAAVRAHVPKRARVVVVSKGDDQLLELEGREAWHFPQTDTGLYAGHYPDDGADAVAHLEALRSKGADFFVVPASALWWLDHYPELREHLGADGELVFEDPASCLIYRIGTLAAAAGRPRSPDELLAEQLVPQVGSWLNVLLPPRAGVVVIGPQSGSVQLGEREVWRLPGLDPQRPAAFVDDTVRRVNEIASAGARFVATIHHHSRREAGSIESLRRALVGRGRRVARQQLAEVFELRAEERNLSLEGIDEPEYLRIREEIRSLVERRLPGGAKILVVSRGDDDLLDLGDRDARHFLQDDSGGYAGYHPADSAHALRALEQMRNDGAEYLLLPASSFWWLEHYRGLASYLEQHGRRVIEERSCIVFRLTSSVRRARKRRWQDLLVRWRRRRRARGARVNNV